MLIDINNNILDNLKYQNQQDKTFRPRLSFIKKIILIGVKVSTNKLIALRHKELFFLKEYLFNFNFLHGIFQYHFNLS